MDDVKKIKKRDGRVVNFDLGKIANAIFKAAVAVGGTDKDIANALAIKVQGKLNDKYDGHTVPSVEEVQDMVEKVLIDNGHARTAKAYILYRQKRAEIRRTKEMMGIVDELKLGLNALKVLESRYLKKDASGKVVESPAALFKRVASAIAKGDRNYDSNADIQQTEEEFFEMMKNLEFMPNSPTLMNAGTQLGQLSACFVLPVEDNIEGIFDAVKYTAIIHKSGGGTGFSFARLRPGGDFVKSTTGVASGPLSFMKVFNIATEVIKQGGKRRGANMGVLRIDHPDILDFIVAKEKEGELNNFNISVGITKEFMEAVKNNGEYALRNPRDKSIVKMLNARNVFSLITTLAWKSGDPGVIFIDRLNDANPTPEIGEIESTNPCGEQPLLPFESCNLGSINLSKMLSETKFGYELDWDKLKQTVKKAVHFLDNVIDLNKYPLPQIEAMTKGNRKIGLGIMGFADMLIRLKIPYNSNDAVVLADELMHFINCEAQRASIELAEKRGVFPNWEKSVYKARGIKRRHATTTTIAPTGTISIISGCSSGIEPLFAVSYVRKHILGGEEMLEVNPLFEEIAKKRDFYSPGLMEKIARHGSVQGIDEVPKDVQEIFVTAHDISPEWHCMMQGVFQKHTENAVSKTVNFPASAKVVDVENVYMLAYDLGCKGVTIYRDRSKSAQVLNIQHAEEEGEKIEIEAPPEPIKKEIPKELVVVDAEYAGGCATCHLM